MAHALAAPAVDARQIGVYGPFGLVWTEGVAFSAGVIFATRQGHGCSYGVFKDISSNNVLEWKLYFSRSKRVCTVAEAEAHASQRGLGCFLLHLLILSEMPGTRKLAWFPWHTCNPFNVTSHTFRTLNMVLDDVSVAEIKAVVKTAPVPIAADTQTRPVQAECGYILRQDICNLAIRRQKVVEAVEAVEVPSRVVVNDDALTIELDEDVLPPGHNEADITDDDRSLPAREHMRYNYDMLNNSPMCLRRYLLYLPTFLRMGDARLPVIEDVVGERTTLLGQRALCCKFQIFPGLVWVEHENLMRTRFHLEKWASRLDQETYDHALAIATKYNEAYQKFCQFEQRPRSPFAWTSQEAEQAHGAKEDVAVEQLKYEVNAAERILRDLAGEEVALNASSINMTEAELCRAEEKAFRKLLKTNKDYKDLQRKLRLAQQNAP